jgi:hypothetical protein
MKTADDIFDALCDAVAAQKQSQQVPENTCPLIDSVIRDVQKAEKIAARDYKYADEDELREALRDVEYALWDVSSVMEQIRTHNDTLRRLGKEWHDIAVSAAREGGFHA